jgi:hypothetical protein
MYWEQNIGGLQAENSDKEMKDEDWHIETTNAK